MHGAIEYSYKLDRKNYFNLWCQLGRLLLRQSHIIANYKQCYSPIYSTINIVNASIVDACYLQIKIDSIDHLNWP